MQLIFYNNDDDDNSRPLLLGRKANGEGGPHGIVSSGAGLEPPPPLARNYKFRSDQIGLSLPSPHASTCGMGVVHTLLTRGVTDSPARVVSELSSSRIRGIGVDEPYVLI